MAVVAATSNDIPLLRVRGAANAQLALPAGPDTVFYVASQTKSYVGLVAAELDADGTLPLATTLAEVWPDLSLPPPADARQLTMLDLLTHQLPLLNDPLVVRTSYEAEVRAEEYPQWLARSEPRPPGFRYDNLGYIVYAAALETVTGRSWRFWLERRLLVPLALTRTSTRTSAFAEGEIVCRHMPHGRGWRAMPPKADALMHAAGGLVTSPRDAATWMQANLRRSAPGIGQETFLTAHRPVIPARQDDGPFAWQHYALGVQTGRIGHLPIVGCRGGYEGARSLTVLAPSRDIGLTLMVGTHSGTREMLDRMAACFFEALQD